MNEKQTLLEQFVAGVKKSEESLASCACLVALEEKLAKLSPKMGNLFGAARQGGMWLTAFFGVLAVLTALNLFILPSEPHFSLDAYPGFWALFGLGVGLVMVFVMKRIIQPLIVRKEDYYGDI